MKRHIFLVASLLLLLSGGSAIAPPALASFTQDYEEDKEAAFEAAGLDEQKRLSRIRKDPNLRINFKTNDFNEDGLPDALIIETSSFFHGNTGFEFRLVSKQEDGSWRLMLKNKGYPKILETQGVDGWPDIKVGLPGLCAPVFRWDGLEYERIKSCR